MSASTGGLELEMAGNTATRPTTRTTRPPQASLAPSSWARRRSTLVLGTPQKIATSKCKQGVQSNQHLITICMYSILYMLNSMWQSNAIKHVEQDRQKIQRMLCQAMSLAVTAPAWPRSPRVPDTSCRSPEAKEAQLRCPCKPR